MVFDEHVFGSHPSFRFAHLDPVKVAVVLATCILLSCFAGKFVFKALADTGSEDAIQLVESSTVSEPEEIAADEVEGPANTASDKERTASAPSESSTRIYVHVVGAVQEPGLQELIAGSRASDAIEHAGGFSRDAAQESVNLARELTDGEQLVVLTREQADAGMVAQTANEGLATPSTSAASEGKSSGLVNLNNATASQLETLPGIGTVTAEKIVADREANGPFSTVEQLTRVSGIGEKKLEALQDLVCV